jgi:atypical dual specificity phosphatase
VRPTATQPPRSGGLLAETLHQCYKNDMPAPEGFSWVDKPLLAAMARPEELDEFVWLREQGIQLIISLSENPPRRDYANDAGLLILHVPVEDMSPPSQKQIDLCMSAIQKAHSQEMAVGVHCTAGLGRTGVIVASYFIMQGMSSKNAIARVRRLRPGSVETDEQADAIAAFARRHRAEGETADID